MRRRRESRRRGNRAGDGRLISAYIIYSLEARIVEMK